MQKTVEQQMEAIMAEYGEEVKEVTEKSIAKVTRKAVQKLKSSSPRRTGDYAGGWGSKRLGDMSTVVYNRKAPGLTHLLENGHMIVNKYGVYGRTNGIKHIAPVEEWAGDELVRTIKRGLL